MQQPPTFAALLKRHRLAMGLSQEQLGERAGLTAQAISTLERGFRRTPYRDTVHVLARALALSPAEAAALEAAVVRSQALGLDAPDPLVPLLPTPPTSLVGRTREVAEVAALLGSPGETSGDNAVRLLTLTGLGGVGKTRLALQAAHAIADRYADGAVFVALAPLRDPTLVATAMAQALRVTESAARALPDALRAHLHARHVLLVLDNFEHVIEAAPLVADLLAACPGLRVLVTSRARLHLSGEQVYPVPPLPTPDPAHLPALADLARVPAVALLVQRATSAAPDFALDAATAPAIATLCAHLDGLPLALELAAARLTVLSPDVLLRRLTPRLGLLSQGARDLPARHQTLRATLDWSYALLGPGAQAVFRRLSLCVGGCTLEAAEAVGAAGNDPASTPAIDDVADRLGALIDQSLLHRESGTDGEARFGMLETVREYGLERLAEAGEVETVRRAHALCYLALAELAEPHLTGPEQAGWGERLERDHDNLRAALTWACAAGEATLGLRLAGALWRFWSGRGHLSEGRRWLRDTLALTGGDRVAAPEPEPTVQARALTGAALLAIAQGAYDEAEDLCARGLALTRERGQRRDLVAALNARALLARERGSYATALADHQDALTVARADGDRAGEAAALAGLGAVATRTADAAAARLLLEQSLTAYRALGDTRGLAWVLGDLTLDAVSMGAHERAETLGAESLALFRTLGDSGPISEALFALGTAVQNGGQYERAEALYEESLTVHRQRGDDLGATRPISALGLLALQRGDLPRAQALLTDALATVRRHDHRWAQAMTLTLLGHVELAADAVARAQALFDESAALFQAIGNPLFLPWLLEGLAGVAERQGRLERAALLCGARDAWHATRGSSLPPAHPSGYAQTLATVRAALGEETFTHALARGGELPLDRVVVVAP